MLTECKCLRADCLQCLREHRIHDGLFGDCPDCQRFGMMMARYALTLALTETANDGGECSDNDSIPWVLK